MNGPFLNSLYGVLIALLLFSSTVLSQWDQQESGTVYPLGSVYFINSQTGFMSSVSNDIPVFIGGEILRTSNGGSNWQRVLLDSNFRPRSFTFLNDNTGYAVGGLYTTLGLIYKTTNSGLNWVNVTGDPITTYLFNLQFVNATTAFAGGMYGVIKTTNAGGNWQRILTFSNGDAFRGKVFFVNENTGFHAGDTGNVYKTTNSGLNWNNYDLPFMQFNDITFLNENTGYICGDSGTFYKTTDQGGLWSKVNLGLSQRLSSMFFPTPAIGYMTAEANIYKSTNGGSNWFNAFGWNAAMLNSIYFLNENTGYTCGDEGRVYKTTTGGVIGINPISTQIPNDFSLSQNYPNPFNPTTNIKFAVPKASFVRLAVFDMLGREVESLVNEQLSPGTYEVDWNAVKFSSGIYLYKLTTNDFNMVKKMSLIK
jgi:photosystem II stability/assembly factor-like uncharacterized protein